MYAHHSKDVHCRLTQNYIEREREGERSRSNISERFSERNLLISSYFVYFPSLIILSILLLTLGSSRLVEPIVSLRIGVAFGVVQPVVLGTSNQQDKGFLLLFWLICCCFFAGCLLLLVAARFAQAKEILELEASTAGSFRVVAAWPGNKRRRNRRPPCEKSDDCSQYDDQEAKHDSRKKGKRWRTADLLSLSTALGFVSNLNLPALSSAASKIRAEMVWRHHTDFLVQSCEAVSTTRRIFYTKTRSFQKSDLLTSLFCAFRASKSVE